MSNNKNKIKATKSEEQAPAMDTTEPQAAHDKPALRPIDEVMTEWEEAKAAEDAATREAEGHKAKRLAAEDDIARRLVAKGKGAAVRMPDAADYTARLDGDRYRLQRARQVRNVSLD